ncbi:hypothetical protein AB0M47_08890 [Hamadaea sp. NPDC051192]|uniref:hypothetical protein n=1 Tax=Hamadaea sp. NPDC051192 TaxID=3154940 RepID=UPI00341D0F3E
MSSGETTVGVRISSVTATSWRATPATRPNLEFDLTETFASFYALFAQLPSVLAQRRFTGDSVAVGRHSDAVSLGSFERAEAILFALPVPARHVVAMVNLDFRAGEFVYSADSQLCRALAACVDGQLLLNGRPIFAIVDDLAHEVAADNVRARPLSEAHTVISVHGDERTMPDEAMIANVLYGTQAPYRPEFVQLYRPAALNRTVESYAATTRHASFLFGQSHVVENSILLTTVQAVATAARFDEIWDEAKQQVRHFQARTQTDGGQMRVDVEQLADTIGNLELELALDVEATPDVGLGSSTPLVEDFHHDLYAAMKIRDRSRSVGQLLARVKSSLESELIAIDSRERADATLSIEAIASLLSVVGLPIFFLLAYFGVNAREVDQDASMFSGRYWPAYAGAALLGLLALALMWPRLRRAAGRTVGGGRRWWPARGMPRSRR